MGKIRVASAMTSSTTGTVAHGQPRNPRFDPNRTLPATGRECRDPETDADVQFDQAPDSSRSRGYGRYEI